MNAIYEFPAPSNLTIGIVALFLFGLLGVAVAVDMRRRRNLVRKRTEREWQMVRKIAAERGLRDDQYRELEGLVNEYDPGEPLRAATLKSEFERCVALEMKRLAGKGRGSAYWEKGMTLRELRVSLGLDHVALGQAISTTRDLFRGQPIWMTPAGRTANWLRGVVAAVDEAHFEVAPHGPESSLETTFKVGDRVRFRIWRESDARYRFESAVAQIDDGPLAWIFEHALDLDRIQARDSFRITVNIRTLVGVLDGVAGGDIERARRRTPVTKMTGRIVSLSATGCAVVVDEPLPSQVLIRVELPLPELGPIEVEGTIVTLEPVARHQTLVRLSFLELDEDVSDGIARYVMQRQQPASEST